MYKRQLLGLDDFRKDAFSTGYHAYLLQKKYPYAEISISCPRLRPVSYTHLDVYKRQEYSAAR